MVHGIDCDSFITQLNIFMEAVEAEKEREDSQL